MSELTDGLLKDELPQAAIANENQESQQHGNSLTSAKPETLDLAPSPDKLSVDIESAKQLTTPTTSESSTANLKANDSNEFMAYDSDTCWPNNTHNIDIQGSAARLDQAGCNHDQDHYRSFTIGPANDSSSQNDSDCETEQRLDMYEQQRYEAEWTGYSGDDSCHKQVIVGICAMAKKAQSKPMVEILRRLEDYFEYIKTLVFEESVILNSPIEEWPLCDCLISFHSKGFPLSKTIEYARLRRPFLINDLDIQYDIQDRRKVYKILEEADIELPRYAVLDRDSSNPEDRELIESDDHIEVTNVVFNKPFVEKPISAEDHNICIYYPAHAGGGSQRLFRKIGCRSSVYSNESRVRKSGSYLYEEFMPTDGTDVKVYTAGPDYAHAEARKSPALDGKVERDQDGKEIRYPVILTNREKLIARKVCLAFRQTVCGFDLLRANGRSYVCDVNGFSFVKSSMKYYEDCSKILGNMMLRALAPQLHIPWSIPFQLDDPPIVPTTFGRMMELRCVIAVIRHGDRTPKQKMKLEVKHSKFFELYTKYGNPKDGHAKLKKPKQLQEVLDIARYLLGEVADQQPTEKVCEPRIKLEQLKSVLEMYGYFSGINRKVQLKYQPHGRPRRSSSDDESSREPSLVLILKWGGELTPAGRVQAEDLGRCFRRLYPASGDYSGPQGLGLLRLHSTFRHDLKIYASDEGRVQMTAGAFAKGFLALEGELTPILFQMVKSANTNGLLDNDCESSKIQKIVKGKLHSIMQKDCQLSDSDIETLNPTGSPSVDAAIKFINNPYQTCEKMYKLIRELNALIKAKRLDNRFAQGYHLYHGETWNLLQRRWAKLEKDFKCTKTKKFDISKIPDIYDCIKYDLQHNQHILQFQSAHELHTYAKALADIVIPQEYGMTEQEKLMIGLGTCGPLLRKIQADLRNVDLINEDDTEESVNRLDPKYSHGVSSPDRHVRTRLYFTSESHIHSLKTALQFGGLLNTNQDEQWKRSMEFLSAISELNYLSQIVIMLYEDSSKEITSDDRFHIEIHFSSGVVSKITQKNILKEPQGPGFRPHLRNKSMSNNSSTHSSFDSHVVKTSKEQLARNQASSESSKAGSCERDPQNEITGKVRMQDTSMIREEVTDDERSNDSEGCHADNISKSYESQFLQSIAQLDAKAAKDNETKRNASQSSSDEVENGDTLTQATARQLAIQSKKCLSINDADTGSEPKEPQKIKLSELFSDKPAPSQPVEIKVPESHDRKDVCGSKDIPVTVVSSSKESTVSDVLVEAGNSTPPDCLMKASGRASEHKKSKSTHRYTKKRSDKLLSSDPSNQAKYSRYHDHLSNLATNYHTIHHCSFTPSTSPKGMHLQGSASMAPNSHLRQKLQSVSSSVPISYLFNRNPRASSVVDVSQFTNNSVGGPSSLISTAVISGSSPDLVAFCPYSPMIRPLETLHNELSLKQFVDFVTRVSHSHQANRSGTKLDEKEL